MRASALVVVLVLVSSPTCARDTPADPAPAQHPQDSVPPRDQQPEKNTSRCFQEAGTTCGAGNLPRIAPGAWSEQQVRDFMGRFPAGTVAVELAAGQSRLVAECKLDGAYTELKGKDGKARLWATNRLLLLPSELAAGCDSATHLVAAFVTRGTAFSAIVVPLPCPSISEATPAQRCIGEGATGAERKDRVMATFKALPLEQRSAPETAFTLENYSLAPDYWLGLELLGKIASECAVREQADWMLDRYVGSRDATGEHIVTLAPERLPPAVPVPSIDEEKSWRSCAYQPAFRKCFPGLFEPSPGPMGCWEPAKRESP